MSALTTRLSAVTGWLRAILVMSVCAGVLIAAAPASNASPAPATATTAATAVQSPAAAAPPINRCGARYTIRTTSIRALNDPYVPAIQKVRVRRIPGTLRVCAEFTRKRADSSTGFHILTLKDHAKAPAAMICGGRFCKWKSDDYAVRVGYRFDGSVDGGPWRTYSSAITFNTR